MPKDMGDSEHPKRIEEETEKAEKEAEKREKKAEEVAAKAARKLADEKRKLAQKAEQAASQTTDKVEKDVKKIVARYEHVTEEANRTTKKISEARITAESARKSGDVARMADEVQMLAGIADTRVSETIRQSDEAQKKVTETLGIEEASRKAEVAGDALEAVVSAEKHLKQAIDAAKKAEKTAQKAEDTRKKEEYQSYEAKYKAYDKNKIDRRKLWSDSQWYKREYWDHKQLEKRQDKLLKNHLKYIWENSPFMKKRLEESGINDPNMIKGHIDIGRLPFISIPELIERQSLNPYFGDVSNRNPDDLVDIKVSIDDNNNWRLFLSTKYEPARLYHAARSLVAAGISGKDIVLATRPIESFWGFESLAESLQHDFGCAVITSSDLNDENRLGVISQIGVTVLMGTTSSLIEMAELGSTNGLDLVNGSVRVLLTGDESGMESNYELTKKLEDAWGANNFDLFGCQDIGIYAWTCEKHALHLMEDDYIFEVLDPTTNKPVGEGEEGELVVTPLLNKTIAITRYRTGYAVSINTEVCDCRRTMAKV